MIDKFNELLNQLEIDLDLNLTPDPDGTCSLKIDDKLILQLKVDKTEENILIGSFLCELPPGKFRESVFINTLKVNGQIPLSSTFAFNVSSSELVLFQYLLLKNLNLKFFKNNLEVFIEKSMNWKEAIERGQAAPISFTRNIEQSKSSIFNKPLL